MIANMLLVIATCICGLTDNLFIGRFISSDALAAVGFFSPVTTAVGLSYVVIMGTQIMTGNLVGAGQTRKVNKLFISSFVVLFAVFAAFFVMLFLIQRWARGSARRRRRRK